MAKILLVCDKVTDTSWQLARSLRSQQHEVIFLTGQGESVKDTDGIEFMAYFKKWSALEGGRLIPALMTMRPQIVHFVLESDQVSNAHLILWSWIQSNSSVVFTMSLLHIEKGLSRRNWVRYLIQHSDIVTCPSVDSLAQLRGLEIKSHRQGRAVLPPVLSFQDEAVIHNETLELEELLNGQKYLIRPFAEPQFVPENYFFQELLRVLRVSKVVLFGSQDHWTLRERKKFQAWLQTEGVEKQWYLTGHQSLDEASSLIGRCQALWLADLDLSPMELTQYFLKAMDMNATLILNPKQARLHAPLWRNGQNCWITEGSTTELLAQKGLKLTYNLDRHSIERKDLVDAPLNELNRLYHKSLAMKQLNT
jgi:hypothetical protein